MDGVDEGILPFVLGSYKTVKRIEFEVVSEVDDDFEEEEAVHIPNQFFKRRELDNVNLACAVLSADVSDHTT
jgi:hypothetical protein